MPTVVPTHFTPTNLAGIVLGCLLLCMPEGAISATTTTSSSVPPPLSSPPPETTLTTSSVTFMGTHTSQDLEHALWVGTSYATHDLFTQSMGTAHSVTVSGLPSTGTLYVSYWTRNCSGWFVVRVGYTMDVGSSSTSGDAPSQSVALQWAANTEVDLAGYRVYQGTSPGVYTSSLDVGTVTGYTTSPLQEGMTYYFAVTAYDISGNESAPS